jgi:hypothetical protein
LPIAWRESFAFGRRLICRGRRILINTDRTTPARNPLPRKGGVAAELGLGLAQA